MAKFCNKCNKKIGFFETVYEGLCIDCYNNKIKEDEKKMEYQENLNSIDKIKELISTDYCLYSLYEYFNYFATITINKRCNFANKDLDFFTYILNKYINEIDFNSFKLSDIKEVFYNTKVLKEIIKKNVIISETDKIDARNYNMVRNNIYDSLELEKFIGVQINKFISVLDEYEINKFIDILLKNDYNLLENNKVSSIHSNESKGMLSDNYFYAYSDFVNDCLDIVEIVAYVYIFCYSATILKNKLNTNHELYSIFLNLINKEMDDKYISNKLYPIYISSYSTIFKEKLNQLEFELLVMLEIRNTKFKEFGKDCGKYYTKNAVIDIYNKLQDIYNQSIINARKEKIYNVFCSINDFTFAKDYELMDNNIKELYRLYIHDILIMSSNLIPDNVFFNIIKNEDNILEKMKENHIVFQAEVDKNRYLNNDYKKEDLIQEDRYDYENLKNGYEFEEYVANIYKKMGYTVDGVTKKSNDQGADVVVRKGQEKIVIQVKFYSNPVGNSAVQEVVASIGYYNAQRGIVVTNSTFTKSAIALAESNSIELVDGNKLDRMKEKILNLSNNNNSEVKEYSIFIKEDIESVLEIVLGNNQYEMSFETDIKLYCNIIKDSFLPIVGIFEQIKETDVFDNIASIIYSHYKKTYDYEHDIYILKSNIINIFGGFYINYLLENMEKNEYFIGTEIDEQLLIIYSMVYKTDEESRENIGYLKEAMKEYGFEESEEKLYAKVKYLNEL